MHPRMRLLLIGTHRAHRTREDTAMEYQVREDEFSIQYALPSDRHFWIRVAKPIDKTLLVTDAFRGNLSDSQMAVALADVIHTHLTEAVRKVVFSDIDPNAPGRSSETHILTEWSDYISEAMRHLAQLSERRLTDAYLDIERGKAQVIFEMK